VEDIGVLAEDEGLARLLGKELPSPDALLDFLHGFEDPSVWKERPEGKPAWVPPESGALRGLSEVNRALIERGADPSVKTATVDHDGTIIESHKREAKVAYEGTRGYQPLLAVWAEQDLILADEFRDGNVAGGEDPVTSVKRAMDVLPAWVEKRYFRGDSADYNTPLLKYLVAQGITFTISADMTKQLRARCVALAESDWQRMEVRDREVVDVSEVEFEPGDWPKTALPLRYVAMRFTPTQPDIFDPPGVKYLAVVTNRPARQWGKRESPEATTPEEVVRWHWGKAGTIEHVHRSLKDELGAGVMPSGSFHANAAWLRLNVLTHNLLAFLRRRVLPERYRDARPKRLRFEVLTLPGKLTVHQSQLSVAVSASAHRAEEYVAARETLLAMRKALARAG
jgi:hypothetical protein